MRKIDCSFLVFLFVLCFSSANAQFQTSWLSDNYAGINSVVFNPALPTAFPKRWDLNLASSEVFLENNYGYIADKSLYNFYQNRADLEVLLGPDLEGLVRDVDFVFDFFEGKKLRGGTFQANIQGPSFLFRINENHHVGLFTGAHAAFGVQNVPGSLSYYTFSSTAYNDDIRIKPFAGTFMSWNEVGLNYGYTKKYSTGDLTFGINVKRLQGYEAFYLGIETNTTIYRIQPDSLAGENVNISFAYSSSLINSLPDFKPEVNGNGLAIDFGMVYKNDSENPDKLYDYKVGFSFMNLGSINFNKNSSYHQVDVNGVSKIAWADYKDFDDVGQLGDVIQLFSEQTLGDSTASRQAQNVRVALPASLNLFGDFSLMPYVFVNTSLIQPIPLSKRQPLTGSHFSITPRFEHRWLGAYLPVNVINWEQVNIGFAARLGYLVIGTENLKSAFIPGEFTGAELFAALKFNPFVLFKTQKMKNKRSVKGIQCYGF